MWCTYNGKSLAHLIILCSDNLGSRQIYEFQIPLGVNHKILRFYIATYYLVIVKVLQ